MVPIAFERKCKGGSGWVTVKS